MKIVLQKYIADSGHCSRRQAEELIRNKKVVVNGKTSELGMKVDDRDKIQVNNKNIAAQKEKVYIILNKPRGYTCTNRKFTGEKNVFDLVNTPRPTAAPLKRGIETRLFVVGRLDKDSRGLVLLTNDGDLSLKMTHPRYGHEKEYIITISNFKFLISKQFINELILKLKKGVDIGEGDGVVKVKDAKYLGDNKFKIILTEGKKRQIRRMFKAIGCEIEDLVRVRIGRIELGNLAQGKFKKIKI